MIRLVLDSQTRKHGMFSWGQNPLCNNSSEYHAISADCVSAETIKVYLYLLVDRELAQICSVFPAAGNLFPPVPPLKEEERSKHPP